MIRIVWGIVLVTMLSLTNPALARTPVPPPGSSERVAILNAVRPAVEAKLGPNVEFVIRHFEVRNGWALIDALPQRRGGGVIDWRDHFTSNEWRRMDGLTVTALLQKRYGRWNLVEQAIGDTDYWYCSTPAAPHLTRCASAG